MTLLLVEVDSGDVLDRVEVSDGDVVYETGAAAPKVQAHANRMGISEAAAVEALKGHTNGYTKFRRADLAKAFLAEIAHKHLPGEHDQDSHGNGNGVDVPNPLDRRGRGRKHGTHNQQDHAGRGGPDLGVLAGVPVLDADEYEKNYGTVVDERSILDADEVGAALSARFFASGDAHIVLDLPGNRYQVMSEFDGADGMRALAADIRDMQHAKIPVGEPTGRVVADTDSPEHSLYVAKDDQGSIWLRAEDAAVDDYLELDEQEAWDLFDALEDLADSFDAERDEDDEDEDINGSDGGKSASKGASMATKSFNPTIKAVGDAGDATFRIASYNEVDKDGDVTVPGFFGKQHVTMVPVHDWNHVPIGKGLVYEEADGVYCDVKFNLAIPEAKAWYEAIKFDMANPPALQQYSYGYEVLPGGSKSGQHSGRQVRYLTPKDDGTPGVKVFEVSPVLQGAGTGTRTVSVKGRSMRINRAASGATSTASRAVKGAIPCHETKTVSRAWDRVRTEAAIPDDARPSELRTVYAHVDPDGDPECKSSYSWPHHHGIGGPANLRACLMGISALNGPAGADLGEPERKGIYDHLAAHLKDADREVPDLRTGPGEPGKSRFADEAATVLASVSGLIDRATDVMAIRRTKGKGMAANTADLLGWVSDEMVRLKSLLSNPVEPEVAQPDDDEIASVVAASIARLNGI